MEKREDGSSPKWVIRVLMTLPNPVSFLWVLSGAKTKLSHHFFEFQLSRAAKHRESCWLANKHGLVVVAAVWQVTAVGDDWAFGQVGSVLPWLVASRLSRLPRLTASAKPPGGTSSPLCQERGQWESQSHTNNFFYTSLFFPHLGYV